MLLDTLTLHASYNNSQFDALGTKGKGLTMDRYKILAITVIDDYSQNEDINV